MMKGHSSFLVGRQEASRHCLVALWETHCKLAAVPGTVESALQHVPVGYTYELTASLVPLSIVLISGVFIGQVH